LVAFLRRERYSNMAGSFEIALAPPHTTAEILYRLSPIAAELGLQDIFFPGRGLLEKAGLEGKGPLDLEGSGPGKRELYRERELPMPMLGQWPSKTAPYGN
jgi:hypothetical protein